MKHTFQVYIIRKINLIITFTFIKLEIWFISIVYYWFPLSWKSFKYFDLKFYKHI